MMKTLRMISLATLGATMPDLVVAESQWTLGLGVAGGTSVYVNQKDEVGILPFVSYETERFRIGLDGLAYKAVTTESFGLEFALALGEAPDIKELAKRDRRFAGLVRDTPVELGFSASYRTGIVQLGASLMQDVASASEGYRAEVTAGVGVPLGAGMFDIGVGARLRDAKLNNFLFGVSAAEANGLRPAYDVGSTVQPFLAGSLAFPVNDSVSLVGFFEYEMLDDKVTKSPLVDDNEDAAIGVGLGVMFTF